MQRFLACDSVSLVSDMLAQQRLKLQLENKAEVRRQKESGIRIFLSTIFFTHLEAICQIFYR
jgi:hypothetical protein